MSRAVRLVSWMVAFVALGAVSASWILLGASPPELEADDAAEVALDALAEVGHEGRLITTPEPGEHQHEEGEVVDVWTVRIEVEGGEVQLRVQQSRGQLVYVDDRIGPDNADRLLTDEEFERIGGYRDNSVVDQQLRVNIAATLAALVIAALGYVIARRSGRLLESP